MRLLIVIVVVLFTSFTSKGINLDSLIYVSEKGDSITHRLDANVALTRHYFFKDNDSCEYHCIKLIELSKKAGEHHFEGIGYHFIGLIHYYSDNMPKSLNYFYRALDQYMLANDSGNVTMIYSTIGNVYEKLDDSEKALNSYNKAKEWIDTSDQKALSYLYHNIGITYKKIKDYNKAIEYYNTSLALKEITGDSAGMAVTYNNFGVLYEEQGNLEKATYYYELAIDIKRRDTDLHSLASSLPNLGKVYIKTNRVTEGIRLCEEAYAIYESFDFERRDLDACECLYRGYDKLGNIPLAYKYYQEYISAKDSLFSYEKTKELVMQESQYEYDKIKYTDSLENLKKDEIAKAQLAKNQAELNSQRRAKYILFGGIAAVALIAFVLYSKVKTSKRQNKTIEKQKEMVEKTLHELELKNREIVDSITYAKRIQSAILPKDEHFFNAVKNAFILYLPKDIVAGDFYWLEEKDGKVLIAAADCTGHGVPGAMVSVFCSNGLNRSVREYGITDPGKILDKTREIVIQEFDKSSENVKDGMDIALISIQGKRLSYAGANNPLWIIRKNTLIIEETKANKQPIGKFSNPEPYTTNVFECQEGDTVYIFTDGFQDQFGGEDGKKFKAKKLKELLISIQDKNMNQQKEIIQEAFNSWKKGYEQLDDVCLIGVRL